MIRTLPFFLGAVMLSTLSMAQGNSEQQAALPARANFDQGLAPLSATCWLVDDVKFAHQATDPNYVINGEGSVYSDPPVNNSNFRVLATPFLQVGETISFSFTYQLSSHLKTGATRIIEAGLINKKGEFIPVGEQPTVMDHKTAVKRETHTITAAAVTPGVYRLAIRMGGTLGDGNCRLIVDDLDFSAPFYYEAGCNPAPVAVDDEVTVVKGSTLTGGGILQNDTDPGQENLSAVLVSNSPDGIIQLNADGTFTFTPNEGFEGSTTTFTYKAVDDGYLPATSNTAIVTIRFVEPATTMMHLLSFTGERDHNKVRLQWEVGFNETLHSFVVEQSNGISSFTPLKMVLASEKAGDDRYEIRENATGSLFRLKLIDKLGNEKYSNTVAIIPPGNSQQAALSFNNPVVSDLEVRYTAAVAGRIMVTLYNASGPIELSVQKTVQKGLNQFSIDASQLKRGSHVLVITNQQGERVSEIFLKM